MKRTLFQPFLWLIVLLHTCLAQEHSYVHYDVKDGLAGATVYCVAQDKDGFIWFGTETGLSRYDGTHFKNFTTADGLPDNEILKVYVDSKNRVWLMPFKNTIAYYWHGKFYTQQNDSILARLKLTSSASFIVEEPDGAIVIGESSKVHIIDRLGRITDIGEGGIYVFAQGALGAKGLIRVSGQNKDMHLMFADLVQNTFVQDTVIIKANLNTLLTTYLGPDLQIYRENDSLVCFDPRKKSHFSIAIPKGFAGVSHINDSCVIINTYVSNLLLNIPRRKIVDSFLKGQPVNAELEDTEGNLWFCTLGQGVYRMGSAAVHNISYKPGKSNLAIFSIQHFDSTLYLGGEHFFLSRIEPKTGKTLWQKTIRNLEGPRGRIMGMASTPDSSLLLLGSDQGLYSFRSVDERIDSNYSLVSVKSIACFGDSSMLLSAGIGVYIESFRTFRQPALKDALYSSRATYAWRAKDETVYVGTMNGLYSVRKNETPYFLGSIDKAFTSRISAINGDEDGTCWVATSGFGLIGYKDGKVVARITEADGLTSNICRNIFISGKHIWLGTDKGLNKIIHTAAGYTVIPYTMSDGLNSDMINAVYVHNSEVYVGTSEGVTFFNENEIAKRSVCVFRMTGITVSDRLWTGDTMRFTLPHKDNNIQFDFVGISFKSSGNIVYSYKLLGLDTAWKITHNTSLRYPSLPSGSYEMQIFATNKFGVRSATMSIPFVIDKLLWEKTWFKLSALLGLVMIVLFIANYRIRLVRKKERLKSETTTKMAELEQMALRSQMNPHFIFNCLNSIQQYVLYKDALGANEFITKFSYLIRQTLYISTKTFISLYEEIIYIETYMELEKKRFENKFIYEIVVVEPVDKYHCHIPPMILQPYIENAIRHGISPRPDKNGKIMVTMEYKDNYLVCTIEDNGVGRRLSNQFKSVNSIAYQSVGMTLVAKRVDMLNRTSPTPVMINIEDLQDADEGPAGTRVVLSFPLEIVLK